MSPFEYARFAFITILLTLGVVFLLGGRKFRGRTFLLWYLILDWVLHTSYYLPPMLLGKEYYMSEGYTSFSRIWVPLGTVISLSSYCVLIAAIYMLRKPKPAISMAAMPAGESDLLPMDDDGNALTPAGRHGCLTTYLVLAIVANVGVIGLILANARFLGSVLDRVAPGLVPFSIFLGLLDIACLIGVFKWQKWGFWGICLLSCIELILNIAINSGAIGLLGPIVRPFVLYGVLRIGGYANAWDRLE